MLAGDCSKVQDLADNALAGPSLCSRGEAGITLATGAGAGRTVLVDGDVEVSQSLTILSQPLTVAGLLSAKPADRAVVIGTSNRDLPPSSLQVHGSVGTNRLRVEGQSFMVGPLYQSGGEVTIEQLATLGALRVTGRAGFEGQTTIGNSLADQLSVQSQTTVDGVVHMRNAVTVGDEVADAEPVYRVTHSTLETAAPAATIDGGHLAAAGSPPRRTTTLRKRDSRGDTMTGGDTLEVHSTGVFQADVGINADLTVDGDVFTPVLKTDTQIVNVVVPPPIPPWHPPTLSLDCGWSRPLPVCVNATGLLAEIERAIWTRNDTNLATNPWHDIGTDPLCTNDRNGSLAAEGYDCEAALVSVECDFDMSSNSDQFPDGTLLSSLCPYSCDACPCNPPWCFTDQMIQAIHNATNATEVAIAYEQDKLTRLRPLVAELHAVAPYQIEMLRFHNETLMVDYVILPSHNFTGLVPRKALDTLLRNQTRAQIIECGLYGSIAEKRERFAGYSATLATLRAAGTAEASLANLVNETFYLQMALLAEETLALAELHGANPFARSARVLDWGVNANPLYSLVRMSPVAGAIQGLNDTHPTVTSVSIGTDAENATFCFENLDYEDVYPPLPPPPPVYREVSMTTIEVTGDTAVKDAVFNASGDVHLGSRFTDGVVFVTSPSTFHDTVTTIGHTDVTTQTAVDLDSATLSVGHGDVNTLAVGVATRSHADGVPANAWTRPSDRRSAAFDVVGSSGFDGHVSIGNPAACGFGFHPLHEGGRSACDPASADNLAVQSNTRVGGSLDVAGSMVLATGARSDIRVYGPIEMHSAVRIYGDINMAKTVSDQLSIKFDFDVTGVSKMWNDVTLGKDATSQIVTNGTATFMEDVAMVGPALRVASGNITLGHDYDGDGGRRRLLGTQQDSLVVNSASTLRSTLQVHGEIVFGVPGWQGQMRSLPPVPVNSSNTSTPSDYSSWSEAEYTYPQELIDEPTTVFLHGNATISNALTVEGDTALNQTTAVHLLALTGAVIGTDPGHVIASRGAFSHDGPMEVVGATRLGSDGLSSVAIDSPTVVDANFSALRFVELNQVTASDLHVTGGGDVDGAVRLLHDVTLGDSASDAISVHGAAVFTARVEMNGPSVGVAGDAVLGTAGGNSLVVNSAATCHAGLTVNGAVLLDPAGTANVTAGAPAFLQSDLTVDGVVSLATSELLSPWGVVTRNATRTTVNGPTELVGTLLSRSTSRFENDVAVQDGLCVWNCHLEYITLDAQTSSVAMTGNLQVDGVVNPSSTLVLGSRMMVNIIDETSTDVGVTVEGITFTKGGFPRARVDLLEEFSNNHGVDIEGILLRDGVIMTESQLPGFTSKGELEMLTLTNSGNSDDMDDTQSTILFRQFYYDPTIVPSSDPLMDAVNARPSGKVVVGTETDWDVTVESRDSYISLHAALDGIVHERMRIGSNGDMNLWGTDGTSKATLNCETGNFISMGNLSMDSSDASIHFSDLYSMTKMPSGELFVQANAAGGAFVIDMGATGLIDFRALTINLDLQGDFNLVADLQIGGTVKFSADPDPFTLDQESPTQFALRSTTVDSGTGLANGVFVIDVAGTVMTGDFTLVSSVADPGQLKFQNAASLITHEHADDTVTMSHRSLSSPYAVTELLVIDGSAATMRFGSALSVDGAGMGTTVKRQLSITSADEVHEFTATATGTDLQISSVGGAGSISVNPGSAGSFEVGSVLTVAAGSGDAFIAGNTIIGNSAQTGGRGLTIVSADSASAASLQLSDSTDTFTLGMQSSALTVTASNAAGHVNVVPGTSGGEFQINADKLRVLSATGEIFGAGDLTIGGVEARPESTRRLNVLSADDAAVLTIVGRQSSSAQGQLALGCVSTVGVWCASAAHTVTSVGDTLTVLAAHGSGSIVMAPGATGQFKIVGDQWTVDGNSGDVVGLGVWTVGSLAVPGSNSLNVISDDGDGALSISTETDTQRAVANFVSGTAHAGLAISQTGATSLLSASGTVTVASTNGVLLDGPAVATGTLTFDAGAAASGGAVSHSADTAAMAMSGGGDWSVTVSAGEVHLNGEHLRFNSGLFVVDGASGDARVSGGLTVGTWGAADASTLWVTGSNTFTLTTNNDWGLASTSATGNIVLAPGSTTGQVQVGSSFAVTGATGSVLVGDGSADYLTIDMASDAPVLAIGQATAGGSATVRFGQAGTSQFELAHTDGQLLVSSLAGTGVLAATVGSIAVNTDHFTLGAGGGGFAGDLTVGGAASSSGSRAMTVQATGSGEAASVAVVSGAAATAVVTLASGTDSGVELNQLGTVFSIESKDAAGNIDLIPGASGGAVGIAGDAAVTTGANSVRVGVTDAATGAVLTLSSGGSSSSTLSQLSATVTLASLDGDAVVTAGAAARPSDRDFSIDGAAGTVRTRADLHVGHSGGGATAAGARTLTVESDNGDATLQLSPSTGSGTGAAGVLFGAGGSVFALRKVADVLELVASGSAANFELTLDSAAELNVNAGVFSVSGAGALTAQGDVTVGCSSCAGARTLRVTSSDGAAALDLLPADASQPATLSLGAASMQFALSQTGAGAGTTGDPVLLTLQGPDSLEAAVKVQFRGSAGEFTIGTAVADVFVVDAVSGATVATGDMTVGGPSAIGTRDLLLQSNTDDATATIKSGYGRSTVLKMEAAGSTKSHSLTRTGEVLTMASGAGETSASVIALDPGQLGELKLGLQADATTAVLSLAPATVMAALRGDLAIGGADAPAGPRALSLDAVGGTGTVTVAGDGGASLSVTAAAGATNAELHLAATAAATATLTGGSSPSARPSFC